MPAGITQYVLQGGPCDGRHGDLTPAIDQSGQIICQDYIYKREQPATVSGGREVFKSAGKVPPVSGVGHDAKALQGWGDLRRTMNHGLPTALRHTNKLTNASLRQIRRHRRVKG